MEKASVFPGGIPTVNTLLGRLILDPFVSFSENPLPADLDCARIGVCGFPRTGTTFLLKAANVYLGDSSSAWKNHDPYAIRDFSARGIPVLLSLRDPLDAALSWAIYHGDAPSVEAITHRLDLFTAWHRIARREVRGARVVAADFDVFTRDPAPLIASVVTDVLLQESPATISEEVARDNSNDALGSHASNTPSEARQRIKQQYADLTDHPRVQRAVSPARSSLLHLQEQLI